ncbi:MAG: ATP-binding protein [Novosphingobium sp.]
MPLRLTTFLPASLSSRIACILVMGLVLAQLLTSTIWFESRRRQMLEIPARVFATRVADTLRLLEARPAVERPGLIAALNAPDFSLRLASELPVRHNASQDLRRSSALLEDTVRLHLRHPVEVRVIAAQLLNDADRPADSWAMMADGQPTAAFLVAVRSDPGARWLIAAGREDENGADLDRIGTIMDYVLRIYLLRILIVAMLTWIAVRLAMKPLKRLAQAAESLGHDLHSPPLATCGPREVRQAAEAFNLMQHRLIGHIEERTRFLAAVSHDLRSPITRLRLRTELLPLEDQKPGFRKDLTEMEGMVEATLSFMQGGVDEDLHEAIDIDTVLAGIISDLKTQGAAVTLTGTAGAALPGFPQGLRRCLWNLAENAVRYGGRADITVSDHVDGVTIRVKDDGPGIPDERLELVFEPFYRQENSRNIALGGVGLGLSIARSIAVVHDGTILLRNHPDGGLEATLHVPRRSLARIRTAT